MSDKQTKICVYCLRSPATVWTGHVKSGRRKQIVAGWCDVCYTLSTTDAIRGFSGQYVKAMGKRKFST